MIVIASRTAGNDRTGAVITDRHFGVNLLFDRDTLDPSGTYIRALQEIGASTLRYPGGMLSERFFDLANPNGSMQNYLYGDATHLFDPDLTGPMQPRTLGLWDAVSAAGEAGFALTFVMPTIRFAGTTRDAAGNRYEAVDAAMVKAFTTEFLARALAAGVTVEAIELGNEWWADNTAFFGETLSAVEYGRIASRLAMVVQSAIDEFRAANTLPAGWAEPEIVVQVGPGGKAEWVQPNGEPVPEGYSGPTVSSTSLIFREFNLEAEQRAIDGIVTHRYLTGSSVDGWAYDPFDRWDSLAAQNANFQDMSRYVSEWNVAARNESATGLLQVPWLVALFAEAVEADVRHANVWTVQQNNITSLSTASGLAGDAYEGLTAAGEAFRILNEELIGLQLIDTLPVIGDMQVKVFGSDARTMLFLSNMTGEVATGTFDVSDVAAGYRHVWATTIGTMGADPLDPGAAARIDVLSQTDLMAGGGLSVSLAAYESICVEFTLATVGVTMSGGALDDRLAGSGAGDTISGAAGNDRLDGFAGADVLYGGTGADHLFGGDGNDTLHGDGGNDVLGGGVGLDHLFGGPGNDVLRGDAGNDRLTGGAGRDTMTGGAGSDVFVFTDLADSAVAAPDLITDFARRVDKISLSQIDANSKLAGDQAFTFIATKAFSGTAGQLRYFANEGGRMIEGDVNGDRIADFRIFLDDPVTLSATDFLL